jgi:hypothetical protein
LPVLKELGNFGGIGGGEITTKEGKSSGGGGSDNSEIVAQLKNLITAVKAGQNIYIDGQKIAQVVASNTRAFEKVGV